MEARRTDCSLAVIYVIKRGLGTDGRDIEFLEGRRGRKMIDM